MKSVLIVSRARESRERERAGVRLDLPPTSKIGFEIFSMGSAQILW